jgi:hypothetical protein
VFSHSDRPSRISRAAALAAATLGVLIAPAPLAPSATLASSPSASASASASATRTTSLRENGNLRLTSRHGFTLNEQGRASGTIAGTIYVHLKIVSSKRVTAEVNIYARGGSISGYGDASYRRAGATGNFSGSLSVNRGTGSYNHARGTGLSFDGTIRRSDYAIAVRVRGNVTD